MASQMRLEHHLNCILQSGLILDENLDMFLYFKGKENAVYESEGTGNKPVNRLFKIMVCVTSLASCAFLLQRCKYKYLLPCIAPSASIALFDIWKVVEEKRNQNSIDNLIKNLQTMYKLNKMILNYVKLRISLSSSCDDKHFNPDTTNTKHFVDIFSKEISKIYLLLKNNIKTITSYRTDLKDEFVYIESVSIDFQRTCSNIEDCVSKVEAVSDTYILLVSNFLCGLAVMLCPNLWTGQNSAAVYKSVKFLINDTNKSVKKTLEVIQRKFDDMKYTPEIKSNLQQKKKYDSKLIPSKLHSSLITSITTMYIVLEKVQGVLRKIEKEENESNLLELTQSVTQLRNHAFETYESLDVLCRLYEIVIKNKKTRLQIDSPQVDKNTHENFEEETSDNVQTINFDDKEEDMEDEEYELYIGENDDFSTETKTAYYDDDSGTCLGLMLEELKKSLREHQRFVAARQKRGITDIEDEHVRKSSASKQLSDDIRQPPPLPKELEKDCNQDEQVITLLDVTREPPPPPPLPNKLERSHSQDEHLAKSFCEQIKTLSTQLHGSSEMFGDASEDDE